MAKTKPNKPVAVLPQDQRLRFFYKFWVLALMERTKGASVLTSSVNLHDTAGNRLYAVLRQTNNVISLTQVATPTISKTYLPPRKIIFSGDECSFWNDFTINGNPTIVIGTGDIRNLKPADDLNKFLLEWEIPSGKDAIYIYYVGPNELEVYAPIPPVIKN